MIKMKRTKRFAAWLLVAVMLLSSCAFTATGEDINTSPVTLMETMADTFDSMESPSEWMLFDLARYGREISQEKKDAYTTSAVDAITKDGAAITEFAKVEIILTALGIDTTILTKDSENIVNNPENLHAISEFDTYSDAIWALISDELDSVTLTDEQIGKARAKIAESTSESGMIFGSYGGYTYDDPDSTGAAVGALSRFVNESDSYGVNELYNKMLGALSAAQLETGSYGSACTDAFVIIGLCAAGIDPASDVRFVKGENSLLDGLMSHETDGGFKGYTGDLDLEWSTEQGLRALIAYEGFKENGNKAYSIYCGTKSKQDDNTENDGTENGDTENNGNTNPDDNLQPDPPSGGISGGVVTKPEVEEDEEKISVTFEMKTHKGVWLSSVSVSVDEKTSVRDLIKKVFDENGIESKGLGTGYLRSVTYNGETRGEFDAGPNSGWQYYVNGSLPRVGISSYKLSDGDEVSLVYTADYVEKETGGSAAGELPEAKEEEEKEEEKEKNEEADKVWENPFGDVKADDWFAVSVQFVCEKGLMKGMTEGSFAPGEVLTRAMFVTVLWRMDGEKSTPEAQFEDVQKDSWYAQAVSWASENGIVNGVSDDEFAPSLPVTREQMATLAYRYAMHKEKSVASDKKAEFEDAGKIAPYALDAVSWANAEKIMTGSGGKFNPTDNSKRSEAAAVFMRLYGKMN